MEATVRDHKPTFVKAPRRVFEKHGGYYSDEEEEKQQEAAGEEVTAADAAPTAVVVVATTAKAVAEEEDDGFKKATREEWNTMSKREKKAYLRERTRRKMKQMVYIKDDSDNEQLTSSG